MQEVIWRELYVFIKHNLKQKLLLVVDAVLVVDVQQFVFDPADLLGRLFTSLVVQTVFLIQLSQTHHGLLTHSPLQRSTRDKSNIKHAKEVGLGGLDKK